MATSTSEAPANPPTIPATPCEAVQSEISKYDGWDARKMTAIAMAENRTCSQLNHNLTASETHRRADGSTICVGSYGVLQVGCLHYGPGDSPDDLATNIRIAHRLWTERQKWGNGYAAWTMYNNGEYKKYL